MECPGVKYRDLVLQKRRNVYTIKPFCLTGDAALKPLTIDTLAVLARTGSVHRIFLTPYPAVDGGGWFLDVDHSDPGQTRQLHTRRGGLRVFRAADAAIQALRKCGYVGQLVVVMAPEGT